MVDKDIFFTCDICDKKITYRKRVIAVWTGTVISKMAVGCCGPDWIIDYYHPECYKKLLK